MKPILCVLGALAIFGGTVFAGPDVIIRERAKQLRDENNARQGVPPAPRPPSPPAGGPAAPAPPAISTTLVKFQTDLAGIKPGTTASAEQKQALAKSLRDAAGSGKPSEQTTAKLVDDLTEACSTKTLPAASRARLATELDAVLNPSKYPQAKLEGIFSDIQTMFQDIGVERIKANAIVEDVKAISGDVQKGGR